MPVTEVTGISAKLDATSEDELKPLPGIKRPFNHVDVVESDDRCTDRFTPSSRPSAPNWLTSRAGTRPALCAGRSLLAYQVGQSRTLSYPSGIRRVQSRSCQALLCRR